MPRKKVNPVEEPEQINEDSMDLKPQVPEEAAVGLDQPPADVPREDTTLPVGGEEATPTEPPQDAATPPVEPPRRGGADRSQDQEPGAGSVGRDVPVYRYIFLIRSQGHTLGTLE